MKCQVAAIQWGGVVAEMLCDLRKPSRFSGGGGSSRIFPWSPNADPTADAIQWGGGVVAEFLRDLRKPARFQWGRGSTIHFPVMGPFYIFCIFKMGYPLFHFWDFQKGGPSFTFLGF